LIAYDLAGELLRAMDGIDEADIQGHVNSMDWRGDGEVSFDEFQRWWMRRDHRKKATRKRFQKAGSKVKLMLGAWGTHDLP